jgi:hypothetical protein
MLNTRLLMLLDTLLAPSLLNMILIVTDHNAFVWRMSVHDPTGKLA